MGTGLEQQIKKPEQPISIKREKIHPPPADFKQALSAFVKNKSLILEYINEMEQRTLQSMKSLKGIPGTSILSEAEIKKQFSQLKEQLNNVKTKKDEKEFYKSYSVLARASLDYIEAVRNLHEVKETLIKGVSFITGVDEYAIDSAVSRYTAAALLFVSVSPVGLAPKTSRVIKGMSSIATKAAKITKRIAEEEAALKAFLRKESDILSQWAISSRQLTRLAFGKSPGFNSSEELLYLSSREGILKLARISDPHERGIFIFKSLIDGSTLNKMTKNQSYLLQHILEAYSKGKNMKVSSSEFVKSYIANGGTLQDFVAVRKAVQDRISFIRSEIGRYSAKATIADKASENIRKAIKGVKDLHDVDLYMQVLETTIKNSIK